MQSNNPLPTIPVTSILNKHKKRDPWFLDDYSINPYIGCSYGCIYCYTRGSKYGASAPKMAVKANIEEKLRKQLQYRAKEGQYGFIAISTSTEPYNHFEKKLRVTRKVLQIVNEFKFTVHILTKSTLVLRDVDILKEIDKTAILPKDLKSKVKHGAIVNISISTLDENLAKTLEPGAPSPNQRLETVKKLVDAGIYAGISFMPVLPFINDDTKNLEKMLYTAKQVGAKFVFVGCLTLFGKKPTDSKPLYYDFLQKYKPKLVTKYKELYRIFWQPTREYRNNLHERVRKLAKEVKIKIGIV